MPCQCCCPGREESPPSLGGLHLNFKYLCDAKFLEAKISNKNQKLGNSKFSHDVDLGTIKFVTLHDILRYTLLYLETDETHQLNHVVQHSSCSSEKTMPNTSA